MRKTRLKDEQIQTVASNTTPVRIDPVSSLETLLKSKNLTGEEIKTIVDISTDLNERMKEMSKVIDASKTFLKERAKKDGVSIISGNESDVTFAKRTTTKIAMSITDFARFLKRIGKVHVFDHVVTVAMTPLKKYVDVHTLETEGVLEYDTDLYGTASFKRK